MLVVLLASRCQVRIVYPHDPIHSEGIPTDIPSMPIDEALDDPNQDEDLISPNDRRPMRLLDSRRQPDGELSDSDDEGEGGRRDHGSHRDPDSNGEESGGNHKFGMGVGILASGSTTTHGAGPSGHHTAVRLISASNVGTASSMDVDTPSTESVTEPPAAASGADSTTAEVEPPKSTVETDEMAVDVPPSSAS